MLWDRDHKKVSQENDQFKKKKKGYSIIHWKKKLATQKKKKYIYIYDSPHLGRLAITLSSSLMCLHLSSVVTVSISQGVLLYILGFQVLLNLVVCCQSTQWSFLISRNQVQSPYFTLILANLLLGLM